MPSKIFWCIYGNRGNLVYDNTGGPLIFKTKGMAETHCIGGQGEGITKCRVTWAVNKKEK